MAGAVMADDAGRLARLLRWCGMALMAAGVLLVVATLLHPSRETATTIVASEPRLVAAHVVYTLAWLLVLLGLPGLYAAQRGGMGRLGLVGFLTAFTGTYLIAVTGNFGFLAPVLAKQSPAVLDSISQYSPVVIVNGLAAILFMIGYVLFGVAMIRTATLPRWSGVLVAVGAPAHLLGFGIAQLVSTAAWPIAILGSVSLGVGLGLVRLSAVARTGRFGRACVQRGRHDYEHRIFGESRRETTRHCAPRTGDHLSGGCRTRRPFLCGGRGADGVGALGVVAARSGRQYRTESLVPHRRRQRRRDHRQRAARPRAATAPDIVGRRTGRGSRCGRRDHPSLPAQLRCHPRSRRDPADRLPVLARRQDVSILVGWCFPRHCSSSPCWPVPRFS